MGRETAKLPQFPANPHPKLVSELNRGGIVRWGENQPGTGLVLPSSHSYRCGKLRPGAGFRGFRGFLKFLEKGMLTLATMSIVSRKSAKLMSQMLGYSGFVATGYSGFVAT